MTRAAIAAILAAFTGFWVLGFATWSPLYKLNLLIHPLVGLAATYFFFNELARRTREWFDRDFRRRVLIPAVIGAVVASALRFHYRSPWVDALVWAVFPLWSWRHYAKDRARWAIRCAYFYFIGLLLTGVAFMVVLGGRPVEQVLLTHRALAFAWLGFSTLSAALDRRGRRGTLGSHLPTEGYARTRLALGIAAAFLIVVYEAAQGRDDPHFVFHLSTETLEDRGADRRDRLPAEFDPGLASKTESCGTSGCHPTLLQDMSISAHDTSMRAEYLKKNIDLLAEQMGEQNRIVCASCHYPPALFDRAAPPSPPPGAHNFSCTFCHQVASVDLPPDPKTSSVEVSLHEAHLRMFNDGGEDKISTADKLLVNMNPFGHGRVFTKSLYSEDNYCMACHRLRIEPSRDTSLSAPRCIDCHMQPRKLLGMEGEERNHVFPGINIVLPAAVGEPATGKLIEDFAVGLAKVPIQGWGSYWEPRNQAGSRQLWLLQKAMPLSDLVAGQEAAIRIITINAGMNHAFPGGLLSLIECWQRVIVTDQDGRELLRIGDLDETHRIDPRAHRLGGRFLDKDGQPLMRNEEWRLHEKQVDRLIAFSHSVFDDYEFEIPEGVTRIDITAQWHYRRLNQDFADWVYGVGAYTAPVLMVTELTTSMEF